MDGLAMEIAVPDAWNRKRFKSGNLEDYIAGPATILTSLEKIDTSPLNVIRYLREKKRIYRTHFRRIRAEICAAWPDNLILDHQDSADFIIPKDGTIQPGRLLSDISRIIVGSVPEEHREKVAEYAHLNFKLIPIECVPVPYGRSLRSA